MDRHTDPQYRSEDGNALRIWRDTAQNNFLSEREGRPLFDEVIYVEVIAPGSGNSTPVFEVVRYPTKEAASTAPKYGTQYDRFKKYIDDFINDEKSDASLSGTPLAQWPEMSRTLVAELKAQKIFTVDALAALPDSRIGAVGPDGRTWREKAKAFLEAAKSGAYATSLAADLEDQKRQNADLQAQVATLAGQVETLQATAGGAPKPAGKAPAQVAAQTPPSTPPAGAEPAPAVMTATLQPII